MMNKLLPKSFASIKRYERYFCIDLSRYVSTKNKEEVPKPQEPPLRTLFIPANNSAITPNSVIHSSAPPTAFTENNS